MLYHNNRKAFATDLKTIYHASDESKVREALERVNEKWSPKYPNSMKRWYDNWDAVSPIFKFSAAVRKVIYTTNSIESLNATYRKLNRQRSVFPSDTALLKALYLSTFEATKKWTTTIRNWAQVEYSCIKPECFLYNKNGSSATISKCLFENSLARSIISLY